jgi:hypothetical protein
MKDLYEYQENCMWIKEYPVHYAGTRFNSRMTIVRLAKGGLFVHSPCAIDEHTKNSIAKLGRVEFIVAPGSYHYLHVGSAQRAFPEAETFICPGIERKDAEIEFDWLLGDRPDERWEGDFEQVLVRGNRFIWEVAFYHKSTRTLMLVDLIENFTDETQNVNWALELWWKTVFRMWGEPKPAPEYQLGWRDKNAAARSLKKILSWDFQRIIIAHGDLIEENAKQAALHAWRRPLASGDDA